MPSACEPVRIQIVVTVQLVEIGCNLHPLDIVPGTLTDAITGVDEGRIVCGGSAEVGTPGGRASSNGRRQRLTMGVGTSQPTQASTAAGTDAGDEE